MADVWKLTYLATGAQPNTYWFQNVKRSACSNYLATFSCSQNNNALTLFTRVSITQLIPRRLLLLHSLPPVLCISLRQAHAHLVKHAVRVRAPICSIID